MAENRRETNRSGKGRFLLCKSFRRVSASIAKLQNLRQFVGDAAGSMPVFGKEYGMGKMSDKKIEETLQAYFEEGLEAEAIAKRLKVTVRSVERVLGDKRLLKPYQERSEAAKLRAQIYVNESAEEAARRQAELLRADEDEKARRLSQQAAKDILDRAGIRVPKGEKRDITIRFAGGMPEIGMPARGGEEADGA